ncbi:MAG: hypothetical protein ABIO49_05930 [Dokdonella sp.]
MSESTHSQSFAIVETTTSLDRIRQLLAMERAVLACALVPRATSPHPYLWIDVCADGHDAKTAIRAVRSTLSTLIDAADRGLLDDFRIVSGANVLRLRDGRSHVLLPIDEFPPAQSP